MVAETVVELVERTGEVAAVAYGSFDSVVAGGGFTNQYAPATTASTTTADATRRAAPTHCTQARARASTDIGGAGRSGISNTVGSTGAPNVSGRACPFKRLGEAKAEHTGRPTNYDATRSESWSRTAVDT